MADTLSQYRYNDPTNGGRKTQAGQVANQNKTPLSSLRGGFISTLNANHKEKYDPNRYATAIEPVKKTKSTMARSESDLVNNEADYNNSTSTYGETNHGATPYYNPEIMNNSVDNSSITDTQSGTYAGIPVNHITPYQNFEDILSQTSPSKSRMLTDFKQQLIDKGIDPFSNREFQDMVGNIKADLPLDAQSASRNLVRKYGADVVFTPEYQNIQSTASKLNDYSKFNSVTSQELIDEEEKKQELKVQALKDKGILNPLFSKRDLSSQPSIGLKTELRESKEFMHIATQMFQNANAQDTALFSQFMTSLKNNKEFTSIDKQIISKLKEYLDDQGVSEYYHNHQYDDDIKSQLSPALIEFTKIVTKASYKKNQTREADLLDMVVNNIDFAKEFGSYNNSSSSSSYSSNTSYSKGSASFY